MVNPPGATPMTHASLTVPVLTVPGVSTPLAEQIGDISAANGRDPAQIEAALDALTQPGSDASSGPPPFGTPDRKKDVNGHVVSPEEGKRRTQYFEDQFIYKDGHFGSARERVLKEAPVIAELRTNVIVKDEFTLVTDMSYHLSTRFARPESSIMINIDHSACLLYAGSFEPAYILTISALPSQIRPTTNKRNAALVQSFMTDVLSVPPERGVIRFVSIPEENLASNGATILGEMERIEKLWAEDNGNNSRRSFTRGSRKSASSTKRHLSKPDPSSIPEHEADRSSIASIQSPPSRSSTPLPRIDSAAREEPNNPYATVVDDKATKNVAKDPSALPSWSANQRKSRQTIPHPILKDTTPSQKVSKRKSFLAVFTRR